jgi:hypothetical protein
MAVGVEAEHSGAEQTGAGLEEDILGERLFPVVKGLQLGVTGHQGGVTLQREAPALKL